MGMYAGVSRLVLLDSGFIEVHQEYNVGSSSELRGCRGSSLSYPPPSVTTSKHHPSSPSLPILTSRWGIIIGLANLLLPLPYR